MHYKEAYDNTSNNVYCYVKTIEYNKLATIKIMLMNERYLNSNKTYNLKLMIKRIINKCRNLLIVFNKNSRN